MWSPNRYNAGKEAGSSVWAVRQETNSAPDITDLSAAIDIIVPPRQVGGRGQEADYQRAGFLLESGLARPGVDFAAIGRVHEHPVPGPTLLEAILGFGKEGSAFGRPRRCAGI